MAVDLVERFMKKIQKLTTYRGAIPTQSVLTITSNVVYGKKTVTPRMVVALARRSDQVLTRCTVVTRKALSLL
ncbi:formate acetyltransferase 1 [Salmonella enterica subsp. enterica]|uniref:Formate acetyltransferase 1 n=1 Tax=Salmonella enterica I TaxID=59201 RepID=A0A379WW79_SALET|nr:formate acetyltransferase 1 [Salmonella enterica subsp. enterica]